MEMYNVHAMLCFPLFQDIVWVASFAHRKLSRITHLPLIKSRISIHQIVQGQLKVLGDISWVLVAPWNK